VNDEPQYVPERVRAAQQASQAIGFPMACDNRTGALLRTLVASKPGGLILELGTGTGVGTGWLLDGMSPDATLITIDKDWTIGTVVRQLYDHEPRVHLTHGDAGDYLTSYTGRPFDMVFVDCRPGKFDQRDALLAHLAPGAVYVGDDLMPQPTWPTDHQPRVDRFLRDLTGESRLASTVLAWSSGLVVAAYRGPARTLAG
jgi:predicted O-methyltransferase YrrM